MSENRIEKLWGHLENMTPDELRAHIRKIRNDRKIRKVSRTVKKTAAKKTDSATEKAKKALAGLSPDAIERLMKGLADK